MLENATPVRWAGWQSVLALPEHVDGSNAPQIRQQLLSVIGRGATVLIADMTMTISCDHAGADALASAYQRSVATGTELRLVVTAQAVAQVLGHHGLDRLLPVYPSLEAAKAAVFPGKGPDIAPAVLRELIDAFPDGVALADDHGMLTLANARLADMFGCDRAELVGRGVESLISVEPQDGYRSHRAGRGLAAWNGPVDAGLSLIGPRLVGLRADGTTFPAEVSLSPVPTAVGRFTLAVIRDASRARRLEDRAGLADPAGEAGVTGQEHRGRPWPDSIITTLFHAGLCLEAARAVSPEVTGPYISEAVGHLDDTIRAIRDLAFTSGRGSH